MKFSIKDFYNKCDQIGSSIRISSHLQKKSLMENFIFCAAILDNKFNDNFRHLIARKPLKLSFYPMFTN